MTKCLIVLLCLAVQFENLAKATIVDTSKPYSYETMRHNLIEIQKSYNKQVDIKSIGRSHFGREIWAIKLGRGKKNIVIVGTHHGREWLTSTLLMKMLESYAEAFKENQKFGSYPTSILDEVSIWFVPMLNPDGVAIQQHHLQAFPLKQQIRLFLMNGASFNFKRWKANGMGIDLNRQYPAGWKELSSDPAFPSYQFYKGKSPVEAEEVIALTQFVKKINPSVAVAYHTAGREIYWRYNNGKNLKRDQQLARKISKMTGYKLANPPKAAVGGGFTDWFITACHRPAMTIEISYLVGETNPPLSVFKSEWKRNRFVGLKLADEAKKITD